MPNESYTNTSGGTTIGGNFYPNVGGAPGSGSGSDSAFPSPPAGNPSPAPAPSTPIQTSTPSRMQYAQSSSDLDKALASLSGTPTVDNPNPNGGNSPTNVTDTTNDPFLKNLATLHANSDAASKALIASTMAAYQNNVNDVKSQYGNYKAGLEQLGVESNAAQATPDLLAGHIMAAGNAEMSKINTLTANEQKAIMTANTARDNQDFKTVNEQMTYLKQIQAEKTAAIKNMYDVINQSNKQLTGDAPGLYEAFSNLTDPKDQHAFIMAVAAKYGVNPLSVQSSLITAKNKEAVAQRAANKASGKGSGGGTAAQRKDDAFAGIDSLLIKGQRMSDGTPYLAPSGFITEVAFKELVSNARADGITRTQFLSEYGSQLDPTDYAGYGLTPREIRSISPKSTGTGSGSGSQTP